MNLLPDPSLSQENRRARRESRLLPSRSGFAYPRGPFARSTHRKVSSRKSLGNQRVFDRVNFFAVRMILNVLFMIGILFYFVGTGVWALCLGIALHGLAKAGGNIAWSLWVTKFAKGDQVAEYMSVHTFLCGVRGVAAPYLAFPLIAAVGPKWFGLIGASLILIATLMIWPQMKAAKAASSAAANE